MIAKASGLLIVRGGLESVQFDVKISRRNEQFSKQIGYFSKQIGHFSDQNGQPSIWTLFYAVKSKRVLPNSNDLQAVKLQTQ